METVEPNDSRVYALKLYLRGETQADVDEAMRQLAEEPEEEELPSDHWIYKLTQWREMTGWQRFRYIGFWVIIDAIFGVIGAICLPIGMVFGGAFSVMGGMFILGCYLFVLKYILLFFGIEGEEVMNAFTALYEWIDTWRNG